MSGYFLYVANGDPSFTYTVTDANGPVNLTGKTVTLSMRQAGSEPLLLDHVTPTILQPPTNGKIQYDWATGQPSVSGQLLLWLTIDGQDTPEFSIPVYTHMLAWCAPCDAAQFGADESDPLVLKACQWATDIMQSVLARQFRGIHNDFIRPSRVGCGCWLSPGFGLPLMWGLWAGFFGWGAADQPAPQGCGWLSQIQLSFPVSAIIEVKVDGVVIPPTAYRVDESRFLVRLADANGINPGWPICQDMTQPDTKPSTWSVAYQWGMVPPQLACDAAAQLAGQLVKSAKGQACALPTGATKVTRQGITIERGLLADFTKGGSTGLVLVDAAIRAYNPTGLTIGSAVYSPDLPQFGRHVGT